IIDLRDNQIQALPSWIGELQSIRAIRLTSNLLRSLPQEIGALRNLVYLGLSDNELDMLPGCLRELNFTSLFLDGNPGLNLPDSIVERPPAEILQYYFESRLDAGQPLRELKLLLVGRGKAGKRPS